MNCIIQFKGNFLFFLFLKSLSLEIHIWVFVRSRLTENLYKIQLPQITVRENIYCCIIPFQVIKFNKAILFPSASIPLYITNFLQNRFCKRGISVCIRNRPKQQRGGVPYSRMDVRRISYTCSLSAFGRGSICGIVMSKMFDTCVSEENAFLPITISAWWAAHTDLASSPPALWQGAQHRGPGSHHSACRAGMGSCSLGATVRKIGTS